MIQNVVYLGDYSISTEENVYSAVVGYNFLQMSVKLIDGIIQVIYILTDFLPS